MTKRERRIFTPEFKKQMVQLYQNRKMKRAIINEYDLTPSSLDRWSHQSGSFKEKDPQQQELLELHVDNPSFLFCGRIRVFFSGDSVRNNNLMVWFINFLFPYFMGS